MPFKFRPVPHPRSTAAGPAGIDPAAAPVRQCRSIRPHRTRGSEVAALAFAPLTAIPAQREPAPVEFRPAS